MATVTCIERLQYRDLNNCVAHCDIEAVPLEDRRTVVIATERADNPGMSIAGAVESMATAACRRCGIQPDKLILINHYPANTKGQCHPELFERVSFSKSLRQPTPDCDEIFFFPDWHFISAHEWRSWGMTPRN